MLSSFINSRVYDLFTKQATYEQKWSAVFTNYYGVLYYSRLFLS